MSPAHAPAALMMTSPVSSDPSARRRPVARRGGDGDRIDAGAFAEIGAGVGGGVDIGKGEFAILDAPIVRHVEREDDFFRQHGRELERLARG